MRAIWLWVVRLWRRVFGVGVAVGTLPLELPAVLAARKTSPAYERKAKAERLRGEEGGSR